MSGIVLEEYLGRRYEALDYGESAWIDRDSFESLAVARSYVYFKGGVHPRTPYRIVKVRRRAFPFVVRFIPSWKLKDGAA